ncbi:hypothetical protein U6B65_00455 [Oscillospiraceae bacterium MB08-C2-2]|nr:hypothetical protein U6B65_00455 [Oscillospiraceae bacterium MB08-C2-2]
MLELAVSAVTGFVANSVSLVAGIFSVISQGARNMWNKRKGYLPSNRETTSSVTDIFTILTIFCSAVSILLMLLTICNQSKKQG